MRYRVVLRTAALRTTAGSTHRKHIDEDCTADNDSMLGLTIIVLWPMRHAFFLSRSGYRYLRLCG